jgi:hypothetical protein
MMDGIANIARREAERVVDRRASGIRVGLCQSYDPATHSVKLALQPEGTLTGWLPLSAIGVGNGFGVYVGATVGHAYLAYFHEGDLEAGIVIGRIATDHEPPVSVQAGETVIKSPTGSLVSLLQDGSVTVQDKGAGKIALDGSGNITLTGKAGQTIAMDASGNITLSPAGSGIVQLGGAGGLAVARNTDNVVSNKVVATSTKVTAL